MLPTLNTLQQTAVTVVLCTFNRQEMLRAALKSLFNLRTGPDFGYEILIVDDGSTDETAAVVGSMMNSSPIELRYIRQDNGGVATARNTGVRHARGNWIAFFDDDELADRDWLVQLVAVANSTNADCVGGPSLLMLPGQSDISLPQTIRRLLGENPVMRERLPGRRWGSDPRRHQNAVPGTGNALVRKELFDRIGLFSNAQPYGEDLQFFRRAQKIGARFATAPDAIIHQVIPASRLTSDYLLALAGKGGASQGQIDAEVTGAAPALWRAGMRFAHLTFWTLPGLLAFSLLLDKNRVLSKKCSARFAINYLAAVAAGAWRQFRGRTC